MEKMIVIVPCYNEQDAIGLFYQELRAVMESLTQKYGIKAGLLFVDDGSTDGTRAILRDLSRHDPRVDYLSFSRNFGKESAMYAGLQHADADYIALMDVDLQDPPELLEKMYQGIVEDGYDCVGCRRVTRKGEPLIRSFFAHLFYRLINRLSKTQIVDGARDYRMMTRQMVDSILSLQEYNRFSKGIFSWVGFRNKWLEYENVQRIAGETKWSFAKLLLYSIDGFLAFSTAPLALSSVIGILFCAISFLMVLVIMVRTIIWGDPVQGYPSLVCFLFFISGVQLFCFGILSQYVSKIYMETKRRPVYILKEKSESHDFESYAQTESAIV